MDKGQRSVSEMEEQPVEEVPQSAPLSTWMQPETAPPPHSTVRTAAEDALVSSLRGHAGARSLPRPISSRRLTVWIGVFSFLCFAYFIPHWDWNQAARMDMTVAAVNHGTFTIDRYQTDTGDKDFFQGHYYSQKAPGQSLMGIPIYAAYVAFMDAKGTPPADRADDFAAQYLVVLFTVAIPMALFLMLFFWFLGYFSSSGVNRVVVTLALGLATDMFAYAHELFGHVPEAVLLFTLFVLAYIAGKGETAIRGPVTAYLVKNTDVTAWLFGLCFGCAFIFEYPPVTIAILIGLYALTRVPLRTMGWMTIGAISVLILMLAYNYAVYHNIRTVGYTSGSAAVIKGQLTQGFGGLVWPPTWDSLWSLSFGPYRGMFFLSPFLLLAFPGFRLWARRGGIEWLLFLSISVLFWIEISMYLGWWGGMATGPRYLIPMLPFLTFPVIFFLDWMRTHPMSMTRRVVIYALFALSIFNTWVMTLTGYAAENEINPLFSQAIPALFQQNYVYNNRGNDLGLTGLQSLFPLFTLLMLLTLPVFSLFLRRGLHSARITMRSRSTPRRFQGRDLASEGANPTVSAEASGAMIVDSRDAH